MDSIAAFFCLGLWIFAEPGRRFGRPTGMIVSEPGHQMDIVVRRGWCGQRIAQHFLPLLASTLAFTLAFTPGGVVHAEVRFTEIAAEAGLDFAHESGKTGQLWTLEITGAGVGLLDFDGDGKLDIWLVQGGLIEARKGRLPSDQLFRNLSSHGTWKFENVTVESGVRATGYGMGITTGDIDNDGDLDVFLTNYGPNQLYENLGNLHFRQLAVPGFDRANWSIAGSFADMDADGWLDLYVGNYLQFALAGYKPCRRWSSQLSYCAPSNFEPEPDRLFRNLGGGQFVDVTDKAGIGGPLGGAMGVVADDFNGDGQIDFYVANDGKDNLLWVNLGNNQFRNEALIAGAAVNADGVAEASMGVSVADYDKDGDPDVFVTHDVKESNTLYRNEAGEWFDDQSSASGVARMSLASSAFGGGWVDVDNDGDMDVFVANGAVSIIESQAALGITPALRQKNTLLINDGQGRYTPAQPGAIPPLEEVGRGTAFGDLDNDGDIDIVVTNNHGKVRLYRNDSTRVHWLGLDLKARDGSNNTATQVWREPFPERRHVHTDGSYASAHDPRIVFGLGPDAEPQIVRVRWPQGLEEIFDSLSVDRYHVLAEGTGKKPGDRSGTPATGQKQGAR